MAGKRRKKNTATEVTATPNDAATRAESAAKRAESAATRAESASAPGKADTTRGELSATPKIEPVREVKATAPAAPGKVPATRGEVATTRAKLDESSTDAALAATGSMAHDREQRIREHAYHIWKHAGEPHGQHDEHWILAKKQLQED
jgi:hypothetical protein